MFWGIGRLLAALGTQSIEVYEWSESDIRKKRLPNGPLWANLAQPKPALQFNGWELAQAVMKADYLIDRNFLLPGLGFLLQLDMIVDFHSAANLSLVSGSPATLNDFTRTSLSGRLAQGLSILFAQQNNYRFAGHLASDPAVQAHLASGTSKTEQVADFLFEGVAKDRMILESKGSFAQADNHPSRIKSVLKNALEDQVDYWMSKVIPSATKGFAVYSCLREAGNSTPSALIFVDPPIKTDPDPIELPEAWVRRRNYAAWMRAMGFDQTATALREGARDDRRSAALPVITIEGRRFAMSNFFRQDKWGRWLCTGLDVSVMTAIGRSLRGDDTDLMAIEGTPSTDSVKASLADRNWSIFPDGSFFGLVDGNDMPIDLEIFEL